MRLTSKKICEIYQQNFDVIYKSDKSALTEADICSNKIISTYLKKHYSFPILSEEFKHASYSERKNWELYWCD